MDISTDKKELVDLVKKAEKGEIVLPEFQRNFVWGRDDITDLLLSIIKSYYIGSFLLLRVDKENKPFEIRSIAGITLRNEELNPDWMVLDGQQRLTSLHYVFTSPNINLKWTKYPYHFYIDLKMLESGEVDKSVWSERADFCDKYDQEEYQFKNKIIPLTAVLEWESWKQRYAQWLNKTGGMNKLSEFIGEIEPVWTRWVDNIRKKFIPIIEIPKVKSEDEKGIAEICAIFEKVNSTGVSLSVFDLLTARLFTHKIDLHKLWNETATNKNLIGSFSDGDPDQYGILILRCIALIRGSDVKGTTLVNLKEKDFVSDWTLASTYCEKALERITSTNADGFGAFEKKWLPYTTMMPILASLLWNAQVNKRGANAYTLIRKWYWSSVFLERYGGSVESTSFKDYTDIVKLFENPLYEAEVFSEVTKQILNNPSFSLKGINRINATYKGIMNLIAISGAKDFMKHDSIEFHELDDHHIFPKDFFKNLKKPDGKPKYDNDSINTILNRTLICFDTNRSINKLCHPSEYLKKLIPTEKQIPILKTHLISEIGVEKLRNDDYEGFLAEREKAILSMLRTYLSSQS